MLTRDAALLQASLIIEDQVLEIRSLADLEWAEPSAWLAWTDSFRWSIGPEPDDNEEEPPAPGPHDALRKLAEAWVVPDADDTGIFWPPPKPQLEDQDESPFEPTQEDLSDHLDYLERREIECQCGTRFC
jgi:hypothetical protein